MIKIIDKHHERDEAFHLIAKQPRVPIDVIGFNQADFDLRLIHASITAQQSVP